jgi:hypothetical protein
MIVYFAKRSARFAALTLALALVVSLMGVSQAQAQDTGSYQTVDDESTLEPNVLRWVEANRHSHGIHILPAGAQRYLLLAWGEKPTGGYSINVTDVASPSEGLVRVSAELTAPGPDDIVTQALTYPYLLIELPAGDDTVLVNFSGADWHVGDLASPSEDDPSIVLEAVTQADNLAPNPLVVKGRARVFEAMMNLVLEDGHKQLRNHWLMLATGGPDWAEFEVALTYPDPTNPNGTVIGSYEDMRDGSLVEVAHEPVAFGSVSSRLPDADGHWAEASIRQGVWAGFIGGYPDGTFSPQGTVTRAEFLKMLVVAVNGGHVAYDGTAPFADVEDHWAHANVGWTVDAGWISVEEDGPLFRPDETLSREVMSRWIARAAELTAADPDNEVTFSDEASIDASLLPWVEAATDAELLLGYPDNTFRPEAGLTRAEAVTVVLRVLDAVAAQ